MREAGSWHQHRSQTGGITIVVALMLLVLLTVAAVGMSRNALRDIVTVGFGRQGAMARNVADSGLEWAIHWIDQDNGQAAQAASSSSTAQNFTSLKVFLSQHTALSGSAYDIASLSPTSPTAYVPGGTPPTDLSLAGPTGTTQGTTLGLTYMGAPSMPLNSKPGNSMNLWAIRADAQVTQGAATFVHAREVWVSTPVQVSP